MGARLITDGDVRGGRVDDPIVIDAGTVITPSALDRAAALGIRVLYRRDGGAGCHPAASGPAALGPERTALPVVHLADGEYLVKVERGRTRIFRLTPKGPVPLES